MIREFLLIVRILQTFSQNRKKLFSELEKISWICLNSYLILRGFSDPLRFDVPSFLDRYSYTTNPKALKEFSTAHISKYPAMIFVDWSKSWKTNRSHCSTLSFVEQYIVPCLSHQGGDFFNNWSIGPNRPMHTLAISLHHIIAFLKVLQHLHGIKPGMISSGCNRNHIVIVLGRRFLCKVRHLQTSYQG